MVPTSARMPDFLIIGVARSGTTALHAYLRQSPQIFMPAQKEPNFFAYRDRALAVQGPGADFINNSVTRLADYQAMFAPAAMGVICGEASPLYLYEPDAPRNIHDLVPQARLVCLVRNPIEQAFSHYLYARKLRVETLDSFTDALGREDERAAAGWQPLFGYSRFARFADQLDRYLALFPREQMLLLTYDRFQHEPEAVIAEIMRHIGGDPAFRPDMSDRPNSGGVPKNAALQDFIMKPNPITGLVARLMPLPVRRALRDRVATLNSRRDETMPAEARAILQARLGDQIDRLEVLLDADLGHWRRAA